MQTEQGTKHCIKLQSSEKPVFGFFLFYWVLGFYQVFGFFLFEQAVEKLVV